MKPFLNLRSSVVLEMMGTNDERPYATYAAPQARNRLSGKNKYSPRTAWKPAAWTHDAGQALDVEVDQVAGAACAHSSAGGIERIQPVQPGATQAGVPGELARWDGRMRLTVAVLKLSWAAMRKPVQRRRRIRSACSTRVCGVAHGITAGREDRSASESGLCSR